jgi:hypothetical protein
MAVRHSSEPARPRPSVSGELLGRTYGVELTDQELSEVPTLAQIAALVERRIVTSPAY